MSDDEHNINKQILVSSLLAWRPIVLRLNSFSNDNDFSLLVLANVYSAIFSKYFGMFIDKSLEQFSKAYKQLDKIIIMQTDINSWEFT